MSKPDEQQIVKREVGERVDILAGLDGATVKELGDGVLEAVVTTSAVDRQNEVIVTDGIDTTNFEKSGSVLYGHDYQGLPIGKPLSLTRMKNKIKVKFQMAVEEYPFAKTVYDLVKGGYLNSVSIGGIVRKWSEDYSTIVEMEMVEFSIVPVPANPQALITGRSLQELTGKSLDVVKTEYHEFVQLAMVDKVKHMHNDEINDAIKTLKNLLAALEASAEADGHGGDTKPEVKRIRRYTLSDNAKAVATQSQRVIKLIKLKGYDNG